jgi:hypothetical protein
MVQTKQQKKIHAMKHGSRKHFDFVSKTDFTESEKMKLARMNKMKYTPKP